MSAPGVSSAAMALRSHKGRERGKQGQFGAPGQASAQSINSAHSPDSAKCETQSRSVQFTWLPNNGGCTRNNPKLYERSFNIPKQGFVPSSPMLKTKVKDNKKVNLNSPIWTPTLVWPRNTHHGLRDSIPVSQQT